MPGRTAVSRRARRAQRRFLHGLLAKISDQSWSSSQDSQSVNDALHDGRHLVVKTTPTFPNCAQRNALAQEVRNHRAIAAAAPKAVAPLVASAIDGFRGPVLVTGHVGLNVARDDEGILLVDEAPLEERDEAEVRRAASEALRFLHEAGWVHGEVELHHLRVDRGDDGGWVAWWTDLSTARKCSNKESFEREMIHCQDIFDPDYCPVLDTCSSTLQMITEYPRVLQYPYMLPPDIEMEEEEGDF